MRNKGLNGFQLKLIAIIAMTADHLAWILFPGYSMNPLALALHLLGRLTAPIMCFLIAEGYHYTHDVRKYALRIMLFAIPSHFAYMFCFGHSMIPFVGGLLNQTSVLWPLAWGVIALYVCDSGIKQLHKNILLALICLVTFPSDWSCIAVLVIISFATNRGNFKAQAFGLLLFTLFYTIVYCVSLDFWYGILQMGVSLSLPLLYLYNGQRGGKRTALSKWFFYIYYPTHLVLIGVLRLLLQAR